MATEDFEGGTAGAQVTELNTIFNPVFFGPEFTTTHHGGSLGATGGDGPFFDPGSSSMVYYLADAPSAEVWALCDNGIGAGDKNILQETFGDVPGTSDGSYTAGIMYDAVSDSLKVFYYAPGYVFTRTTVLTGVEARGWLKLQSWALSATSRNYKVYATDGTTLLVDTTVTIYDPALMTGGFQTTGYSLGVMSQAKGAAFTITVDDFMCPIEEVTTRVKHKLRVHPRDDEGRVFPPPRSQQASNRTAGGTYL